MRVKSQNPEFGYELISALPYAYYLYSEGLLKGSESAVDTKCLYYFSPNHKENDNPRSFFNTPKANKIPNIDIHKPYLNKDEFLPPPLKKHYANDRFKFKKETIVICNRINKEWNKEPINFFDVPTLRKLFKKLQRKYQIIYINIEGQQALYDNAPPISIGDYDLIKKEFSKSVINIHDLHEKNTDLSFNELQLMIFANCQKFITMNGGHSILCSYFGGENIIMSKYGKPQAKEIKPEINSFYRWYNELGDSRIIHVENEQKLLSKIQSLWVRKDPICNILVRTSNRPHAFNKCMESIYAQDYENINVFVSFETIEDFKYIVPEKCYAHNVTPEKTQNNPPQTKEYGIKFHSNLYLNELTKLVKSGFVMYLDDDDKLTNKNTVSKVAKQIKTKDLVFWRVKIGNNIIPDNRSFESRTIEAGNISGIGFAFNSKFKDLAIWTPYKRGDYRVAKALKAKINKVAYVDEILTEIQNGKNGYGKKEDNGITIPNDVVLPNIIKKDIVKIKPLVIGYICKMPNGKLKEYKNNLAVQKLIKTGRLKIKETIYKK